MLLDLIADPAPCAGCGAEVPPQRLACPVCRRLVHAEALTALAGEATALAEAGQRDEAVAAWRRALELLPPEVPQADAIRARIDTLTRAAELEGTRTSPVPAWLAPLGAVGLALWKFKFVVALALSKGKLLLAGLSQSGTLLTMLASMGLYWTLWGWRFAVGFVVMIYIHEMGHVAALLRLGIAAHAPMFIPGLGAVVRLAQYPASAREDARVGLAGPRWGLGATVAAWLLAGVTGQALFAALTQASAVINLFNLTPVWQLDGARGLRPLARPARLALATLVTLAFLVTREGTLVLVGAALWWRAWGGDAPEASDRRAFLEFAGLIVGLVALSQVTVPGVPAP